MIVCSTCPASRVNRLDLRVEPGEELDVLAEQAAQHRLDVPDDDVEVDHFGAKHLLAAEREQLVHERFGPLRRTGDLLGVPPRLAPGRQLREQEVAVPLNRGEQVVEVVRDAAGQPAHGVHAL